MLVLLPPSETKRAGGDGPPLAAATLCFPELEPLRKELVDELVVLAADVPASRAALGLSPRQDGEIERNAELWTSATAPALTGTPACCTTRSTRGRSAAPRPPAPDPAGHRIGAVRAAARHRPGAGVPPLRGVGAPGRPTLAARWRPLLDPVLAALAAGETVVDLRSGSYAALGRAPGAVTVNVLAERADGGRAVVSHFNKAHKGRLARALAVTRAEPADAAAVAAVARRAGLRVERSGATHLDVIVAA